MSKRTSIACVLVALLHLSGHDLVGMYYPFLVARDSGPDEHTVHFWYWIVSIMGLIWSLCAQLLNKKSRRLNYMLSCGLVIVSLGLLIDLE